MKTRGALWFKRAAPRLLMGGWVAAALWLGPTPAWPATFVQEWVQHYVGPGDSEDHVMAIAVGTNGDVVVTGYSHGNAARYDYATVKYSNSGEPLWTNRYNTSAFADAVAHAVAVDSQGNVLVTGYAPGSAGGDDYATIKYSSAGVPLWTNRYQVPAMAVAVAADSQDNVIVTGYSAVGVNSYDYATVKYSSAGVPLWTKRFDGLGHGEDRPAAMAVDTNGNVFVTGSSFGSDSSSDYATIKYSGDGAPLWTNRYDGSHLDDAAAAVALDADGNVFVTGSSTGTDFYGSYATIKYSNAGVPLWTNYYAGPGSYDSGASALAVDATGNVFVTGYSAIGANGCNYATIKYSNAGLPLWTNRYHGPGNNWDRPRAVAVDARGTALVTGFSPASNGRFDYATLAYAGSGTPLWTNRYNGPLGLDDSAAAIALDSSGNVFVTGDATGSDGWSHYTTIKYARLSPRPVPLETTRAQNQLVLSWTNTAFMLQRAPAATGPFTNVPSAASPWTNALRGTQQFFRLSSD